MQACRHCSYNKGNFINLHPVILNCLISCPLPQRSCCVMSVSTVSNVYYPGNRLALSGRFRVRSGIHCTYQFQVRDDVRAVDVAVALTIEKCHRKELNLKNVNRSLKGRQTYALPLWERTRLRLPC